ncbi:nucleotidyltransferase family protein [Phytohabitans suffuscus]|uniref:4-diphosphocytidyl-2C-methyl-D-erythritol synthase n=1 Tax=Phytohabitans suffuscus TaxID=624315 RepID=A0A6F8YB25_9ACTN|nr:NTP transferase domain-containing protein [Phytohabitans suffuscus]BCB83334.1 4-diphosphocytidyl-2C-methyl-D-erythritol synthase [Phytohabitans suffuscus]
MVIAAGGGRRIGGPEALLQHEGTPLVDRAIETVRDAGCEPVVVVLGAAADEVQAAAELKGASVVVDKTWGRGIGSSLRVGLTALTGTDAEAVVVVPVDMPGVTAHAVRRVAALPYSDVLVCATYEGRRSYPMLFGRKHWPGISTVAHADAGARPYLLAHKDEVLDVACDRIADGARLESPEVVAAFKLTIPAQRTRS